MPDSFEGPLAIISDIHGNLDALATVLKDIAANRCRAMVCLGDIVGYGPEPGACVKLVREYASAAVVGNHEVMFLAILREGPSDRETTNGLWKSLALGRKGLTAADTKWVRKLPLAAIARDMTFVHSSLHHPHKFDDIYNIESARLNFDAQETPISFHGHTHTSLSSGKRRTAKSPATDPARDGSSSTAPTAMPWAWAAWDNPATMTPERPTRSTNRNPTACPSGGSNTTSNAPRHGSGNAA